MSRTGQPVSAIGRVAAAVRQHFADPTFYARRYRASVGARDALSPRRRAQTSWLPRLGRSGAQPKAQPDAIERWMARPAVFLTTIAIGLAMMAATLDVRRDASLLGHLPVMAGFLAAWLGLVGALSYVGRRWPQAEPVLVAVTVLLGITAILCGVHLGGRAISTMLVQAGLFTLGSLAVAWWKSRPGKGER